MAFNLPTSTSAWESQSSLLPSPAPVLTITQTSPVMLSNDLLESSFPAIHKEDKLPHDASVFVGSLPSNIDQGDLTRMLVQHLSEHTQVKNIKVVRDSKGGVCAFVQCENAISATALIKTLHSGPPKPFLGRILRYEPARAFRTLLVSYRKPTKFARPVGVNNLSVSPCNDEVDLELPTSVRVWKFRNSKFHSILYNSDALQAEGNCNSDASESSAIDYSITLHPLDFGEESLHKLLAYFGCLEAFSPLQLSNSDTEGTQPDAGGREAVNALSHLSYPAPHNAPRSLSMDNRCWEVKWEHRDDCVSALMTLRRVPHLTVTWAHQLAPTNQGYHPNFRQILPSPSRSFQTQQCMLPSHMFSSQNGSTGHRAHSQHCPAGIDTIGGTVAVVDRLHPPPSELTYEKVCDPRELSTDQCIASVTTIDQKDPLCSTLYSVATDDCITSPLFSLTNNDDAEEPAHGVEEKPQAKNSEKETTMVTEGISVKEAQELYMPQTPALDKTSITPNTPGSQFPITPTSCDMDEPQQPDYHGFESKEKPTSTTMTRPDREIDPTTLFVGGLEMFGPGAWDEDKVRSLFARFGGLESVKVVRPVNACAAFAFVKFNNAEAPARAIFEEHNRVYEGRAMRVQLRDCNPPRNSWKYGRGRGRHYQNQYGIQRRFQYRSSYDAQDHISLRNQKEAMKLRFPDSDNPDSQMSSLATTMSSVNLSPSEDNDAGSELPPSSSDLSSVARNSSPAEKYREWYDEPISTAHTPEPSSLGSSFPVTGAPFSTPSYTYPVSHGPYFPPQPWVQPYISQAAYQVPYYAGYPVYSPGAISQTSHQGNSPVTEGNGPTVVQPSWPQVGVYASYIPYPAIFPRGPAVDQAQIPPIATQAPLTPTGFIQNEQGTLIPVYQPEALDQYMANSGGSSTSILHNAGPPRWNNTSPYPYELGSAPVNNFVSGNQIHARPLNNIPTTSQPYSDFQPSPTTPIHGDGIGANIAIPLYRRQGQRREIHQNYTSVRQHAHPRSNNGRLVRGHMHNSGQLQPPDLGHPTPPATGSNNNHWSRWNGTR